MLADRDGTRCAPAFTAVVCDALLGMGRIVAVNHPVKGMALVRAFADPACGQHSLQLEVNKLLYGTSPRGSRTRGLRCCKPI